MREGRGKGGRGVDFMGSVRGKPDRRTACERIRGRAGIIELGSSHCGIRI